MIYEKKVYNFVFTKEELKQIGINVRRNANGEYAINTKANSARLLEHMLERLRLEKGVEWFPEDCVATCKVMERENNGNIDTVFLFVLINRDAQLLEEANVVVEQAEEEDEVPIATALKKGKKAFNFDCHRFDDRCKALFTYGENMNAKMLKQPAKTGCDAYVDRIIQTLARKTSSCPLIVGDKGVGKTTVVEEFIKRLNSEDVPDNLKGCVVYSLNMAKLVSGAKYRGDFEERFINCLEEAKKHKEIILFLDNVHEVMGAGAVSGDGNNMDGSSILAPYITDGTVSVIGTTTFENYAHRIEGKGAIDRAFQMIHMKEPVLEVAQQMLNNMRSGFEEYHHIKIDESVTNKAVELAKRYVTDRKLPDSAVDIIDEACAKAVCAEMQKLDVDTVYAVVSERMGIPANKLSENDVEKLTKLEETLSKRVIGQAEAIKSLAKAIQCSRTGLNDEKKPLGSFIFAGSTGVGKTELCKTLAAELFDDETAIVRIDMSEYMESHTVSKLIGAPKGYVGYGEGGYLTDAVAKKPYSIVLFDEIEKAHPQIMNILLQVLDDGRLTDSTGKTVDFKNTIIIMTTNVGAKKKGEDSHIGFGSKSETDRKQDFMSAIKAAFKPEFINRISDIIVFNKLEEDTIRDIVVKLLDEVVLVCAKNDYTVTFDETVIDYCIKNGYDSENGVRPMQHFINKNIKSRISEGIIAKEVVKGGSYHIVISDTEIKIKEGLCV